MPNKYKVGALVFFTYNGVEVDGSIKKVLENGTKYKIEHGYSLTAYNLPSNTLGTLFIFFYNNSNK
jgi:hypothetical protein